MKSRLALSLAALSLPCLALSANDGKPRTRRAPVESGAFEGLRPFDKNGNRQIDPDELVSVQQTFSALRKLDKNSNGDIDLTEVAPPRPAASTAAGRSRAGEALKKVDKNGNGRIDPDETEGLQQLLAKAPAELMKRLDQDGDGKLEESEISRLNERLSRGGGARPGGAPGSSPSFRKPPAAPSEAAKPAETVKPAEKPAAPESTPKPEVPPNKFGS